MGLLTVFIVGLSGDVMVSWEACDDSEACDERRRGT
jgi:hypothetical protein